MASRTTETVLYRSHPVMFRANPIGFLICVLLIPVGIGAAILLIWALRTRSITLTVTEERSTLRTGILAKRISEVYHSDVRNVQISQSFSERLLGIGSIGISSAAQSDMEVLAPNIRDPYRVKEIIDQERRKTRHGVPPLPVR